MHTFGVTTKEDTVFVRYHTKDLSNPVCSPCFRTSASVYTKIVASAVGLLSGIYEFNLSTRNSTILYGTRVDQFSNLCRSQAPKFKFELNQQPACSLRPMIMNNARPPRITAAAGTRMGQGFFFESSHHLPRRKSFTTF